MEQLPAPLAPLAEYNQFCNYKLEPKNDGSGKVAKFPVNAQGQKCDPHVEANQLSAAQAIHYAATLGDQFGVAFVFTDNDPFFFIDLDSCLTESNEWNPTATDIMNRTSGAAIEVSQSGRGLHIFGRGTPPDHGCKNMALGLEFYTRKRFVALTGTNACGNANTDHTGALASLVSDYFPPSAATTNPTTWTSEPHEDWAGPSDDTELVERALKFKSKDAAVAFGGQVPKFKALWCRDVDTLSELYPKEGDDPYDASTADAALAQTLAWLTGNNCEQIERLMRVSGLQRDKYNWHKNYLKLTITQAVAKQFTFYNDGTNPKPVEMVATSSDVQFALKTGSQILPVDQQLEHFKGCYYVCDMHRVFIPNGSTLKPEQFNAVYGGFSFLFDSDGKTVKKAFEALTESQLFTSTRAHSLCFRPEHPPGEIIEENGSYLLNSYIPITTPRKAGNPQPFLNHLAKLLPVESDREVLLAYLAAMVQHKGSKFQWCPLIQGTPGNGKSLITSVMREIIGAKYSHSPKAMDIANKFNSWLSNKLFINIEDIYVPEHKGEVIETLKPMITDGTIEIQHKGADQVSRDNRANFIVNTNHKNAIKKDDNDRRFAIFYTAQQTKADMVRDGMTGSYFPELYNWLRVEGYAIVHDYLAEYSIPDALNPATMMQRAPLTSSTGEAVELSLGVVEQSIQEAIDEGRVGFCGGWVSSVALDKFLSDTRKNLSQNKRSEALETLGYTKHPTLKNGRLSVGSVIDDNKKPRIYIKKGHIHANLTTPAEVSKHYQAAQGQPMADMAKEAFK